MLIHPDQNPAPPLDAVAYELLAAAPPQLFADLVHLAAVACGAPQAFLALAGPGALVFKAPRGFAPAALPALGGFCRAVMQAGAVVDGWAGPAAGPAPPHFCAGVALRDPDGSPLGALCVFAPAARPALGGAQREALACLARRVAGYLAQALAQRDLEMRPPAAAPRAGGEPGRRPELFVKQDARLLRVPPADVTHFEALGDYVNLYTVRERLTVYGTMKDMQARLPAADFARVHRKYIIRLDRLLALEGDTVLLDAGRDGTTSRPATAVPIGSSYKAALLARLQIL